MATTTFSAAHDAATTALRRVQTLARMTGPSIALDIEERDDLALLLEHPELRARRFDDQGTCMMDLVAALLAYKELSIADREWLSDILGLLLAEVSKAVEAMAACVRTPEVPDASQDT